MSNDSSTGGPLLPAGDSPQPLEGDALLQFLQQWLVGLTGLAGNLVRPYWQGQTPNIPQSGTAWAALGVKDRPSDTMPNIRHNGAGNGGQGEDILTRHEELDLLCSFYDTGSDGQADYYAALCRDGTAIPQNREVLVLSGFGLVKCGVPIVVPSLLKTRWLYRVDLPIRLRRAIVRTYAVRNLEQAVVEFYAQKSRTDGSEHIETQGFTGPPVE